MSDDSTLAPVILLGRGGSGTRVLAQLALANGVFLGNRLNASFDSVEWAGTIYALVLESLNARTAARSPRDFYWQDRLREHATSVLAAAKRDRSEPWGWKLPETMLVLPQVLRAFPNARVVHIIRHPVASSVRRTHMTSRTDNEIGRAVLPAAYRACGLDPDALGDDEPYVHNAVTWEFQVGGALDELAALPASRQLELRYEDVIGDAAGAQARVATFLERPAPDRASVPVIEPERAYPAVEGDELAERAERIWAICGATALRLRYSRDDA